jgi:hypothetical protein
MQQRGNVELLPVPLRSALPSLTGELASPTVLFPGAILKGAGVTAGPVSADDIKKLRSGELAIYVYGEVFYSDIYGKKHFTQFCTFARASQSTMEKLTSSYAPSDLVIDFVTAPVGNEAT